MTPLLLTREQAAEALAITVKHFDRHVAHKLPRILVGRLVRFRAADLEAWVDRQARGDEGAPRVIRRATNVGSYGPPLVLSEKARALRERIRQKRRDYSKPKAAPLPSTAAQLSAEKSPQAQPATAPS